MINRSRHQIQETLVRMADFSDEGDIGSELGCDGSGPCEEESEHDHMEEEGEDEHLEGEGDLI